VERLLQAKKLIDVTTGVMHKSGGSGTTACSSLAQQSADGHHLTLLIGNLLSNHVTGRSTLSADDFTCTAHIFSEVIAIAVRSDSPLKSAKDLLAKLNADPSSISAAVGTAFGGFGHIALAAKGVGGDPKKYARWCFPACRRASPRCTADISTCSPIRIPASPRR